MNNLHQAIWVEFLKAYRSKMPLFTAVGFSLMPLVGGLFMIILKDPDLARRLGIISTKAQLVAGSADWQTYLGMLAQATAIGGIMLFNLVGSWIFGREYSDRTIKDLLALPTSRATIMIAKFVVLGIWSAWLTVFIYLLGLGIGLAVGLPPTSAEVIWQGTSKLIVAASLMIALTTPIVFFANVGRGYLLPMGMAMLALFLAQVIAATGWGEYFPWAVPALSTGMAGPQYTNLGLSSYVIVVVTSVVGIIATLLWCEYADQTQ